MALSVALLVSVPFSTVFWAIWLLAGLSDAADGFAARRTGNVTRTGQLLDSVADVLWLSALACRLLPEMSLQPRMLYWIAAIALLRVISLAVGAVRFHRIAFVHTWGNKATGLLLFCFPLLFAAAGQTVSVTVTAIAATLSAAEELAINAVSAQFNADARGIWDAVSPKKR